MQGTQVRSLGWQDGEGNGKPLQYSCLENPMVRGAWAAAAVGWQRVGRDDRLSLKEKVGAPAGRPTGKAEVTVQAAECCGKARGLDRGWRVDGQPPSDLRGRAWKGRHTWGARGNSHREGDGSSQGGLGVWARGSSKALVWQVRPPTGCPRRAEMTRCPGRGLEQPPESPVPRSCRFPSPEGGATWWGPTASCGEGGFPSPTEAGPTTPPGSLGSRGVYTDSFTWKSGLP